MLKHIICSRQKIGKLNKIMLKMSYLQPVVHIIIKKMHITVQDRKQ